MRQCIRCRVYGRVQGVWFRGSTQAQAARRGLTGYASNLPNGSVEVLACGPVDALDELRQWLRQGPPSAQVERMECKAVTAAESHTDAPSSFEVRG